MSTADGTSDDTSPAPGSTVAAEDGALAEFAQTYVKRLSDEYVKSLPSDQLDAQVRSVFEFASAAGTARSGMSN